MIKLEIMIDEVEYDAILKRFWPVISEKMKDSSHPAAKMIGSGLPPAMVQGFVAALPQSKKDKFAADFINSHEKDVVDKLEDLAKNAGIGVDIASIRAEVK